MKTLVFFAFLSVVCIQRASGISASVIYRDPGYPGKCAVSKDLILSPGDVVDDPQLECGIIVCALNGLTFFHGCNKHVVKGCVMGAYVDKSLPYPLCCQRRLLCD